MLLTNMHQGVPYLSQNIREQETESSINRCTSYVYCRCRWFAYMKLDNKYNIDWEQKLGGK